MQSNKYAGFFIRLVSFGCDWAVLSFIPYLYLFSAGLGNKNLRDLIVVFGWYLIIFVILGSIIDTLYKSLTTAYWGQTLGKYLTGLRVINEKRENLSIWRSLFRHTAGYAVSWLLFGYGYFRITKDPKKQGWHDQLTGSYVVKTQERTIIGVIFLLIMVFINGFFLFSIIMGLINNQLLKQDLATIKRLSEEQPDKPIIQDSQNFDDDWMKLKPSPPVYY